MKRTSLKNLFLLPVLIAGLGLIPAGRVTAQTFTTLHSFTAWSGPLYTNSDGYSPQAGLILSGNTLYGTAYWGGTGGNGTVFKVNTDGAGFTTLHSFTAIDSYSRNNSDGAQPLAVLVLSGNTLYGTANGGGSGGVGGAAGAGTVFAVNTDGTGFTNLHNFTGSSDGEYPNAGLVLSGNTLYGTAFNGGSGDAGTVFKVNTDGTGFTTLHSFIPLSDGSGPAASLILSGNTLYGTTYQGGSSGWGTVFAVNTNGSGFTNLHTFIYGSDGAHPSAGLVLSGNTLYGTTEYSGSSGQGMVFAVNTDGSGFTKLYSFTALNFTNIDGAQPCASLILSGTTLFGTANRGGISGMGTVFAVNTDGSRFTNLHSFTATSGSPYPTNSDGTNPQAGLILSGNTLYGTANGGGSSGYGPVFSLSLTSSPILTLLKAVKPSFSNLTLSTNYQLQISSDMKTWTNQGSPFTATNTSMVYPQYWDVDNWNKLFFRLQVAP
jgi:uncharacterized repeat protein (TIGR03803 family)